MDQEKQKTREAPQGDSLTTEIGEGSSMEGNSIISESGISIDVGTLQLQGSPPRRKRSGAEKRRRRRAREALSSGETQGSRSTGTTSDGGAKRGEAPPTGGAKRGRSETSTPSSSNAEAKRKKHQLKPSTFSQAVSSTLRVAIAGNDFPETRLDEAQLNRIQSSLERAIDSLPIGGPIPRFEEFKLTEQGLIIVHCSDESSKEWLKVTIGTITPWEGSELQLLENELIPRLKKITAWIPGAPQDQEVVFKRLERQNPGLKPGLWKVHERKVVPKPSGVRLILGIDSGSYGALRSTNFRAYAGMVKVTFTEAKPSQATAQRTGSSGAPSGEPGTSNH